MPAGFLLGATMEIVSKTNGELFILFSAVMRELRRRDLVRTANNPVADLGEILFCGALGWRREHHQGKDFDAVTAGGEKVQIKARRMTRNVESSRSGTIRDKEGWDLIALAMFDSDFVIRRAIIIPRAAALEHLKWSNRQKGWYVSLTTTRFWKDPRLLDVTNDLVRYATSLFHRSDYSIISM